ncbi:MAG: hypothetical protein HY976_02355, partial [Candidatus Kerfeldbacteria bacterium]|nr:hypothetical protein [Candidatus Kerfeldbacteria bacterium]
DRGRVVYRTIMPFAAGIYPTSDWALSEAVTSHYRPLIPGHLKGRVLDAEVRVMRLRGDVVLNGVRSLVLRYNRYETVGSPISLGQLTVTR